jgi:hypothetical protein
MNNIQQILDQNGIPYDQNSKSFILTCPVCSKKEKLYVRKVDGRFICWYCAERNGFEGAFKWALSKLLYISPDEAERMLYGDSTPALMFVDLSYLRDFFGEEDELPVWVPDDLPTIEPHPGFRPLAGTEGQTYLESRGIPLVLAQRYDILYWPQERRVVFPVKSGGTWLGWQVRSIDKDGDLRPKALTSVGLKKDRTFMFSDRIKNSDHIVLTEGPVSALKAHLCGGNVASLGKAVSRTQLQIIKHSGVKSLYLALDPDAFSESQAILLEMSECMDVYHMELPYLTHPGIDLGDLSFKEVKRIYDNARRIDKNYVFLYIRDTLKEFYDSTRNQASNPPH